MAMLSVDDAISILLKDVARLDDERVALGELPGRVAAENVTARITQPPFAASAMDGYAVRVDDAGVGAVLNVIGEAPAGAPFEGTLEPGAAVRIFTGAAVPAGADHIVIQEDVTRDGDKITVNEAQTGARHIREAGIDFKKGDPLVEAGEILHEIHGAILAAANVADVAVIRKPRVHIFSNGNELREPGETPGPGEVINSNHYAVTALAESWGGASRYVGCAPDDERAVATFFEDAANADVIVPIGGASVGDYDFVKSAFRSVGGEISFEKIAVKPGKPTWFGRLGGARVLGLPGNPASAIVTASRFLQPLVRRLSGREDTETRPGAARLTSAIAANGPRESYLRAWAQPSQSGGLEVTPAQNQDSSRLFPFSNANVLIRRRAKAPNAAAGETVKIVWLR